MPAKRRIKIVDETHIISRRRGNGKLRREIWIDEKGRVVRYNLAFVHLGIHHGDNGRVLGYDNSHGRHHRHYMGKVENIEFISFEETESQFEREWIEFLRLRT